ncbi:MAG TPA: histidinol dehydrogenase, partial [Methylomirabilota bacterium]|nr:histidinol dehydrogenase [Methylomirabilota bacterium]
MRPRVLNSRTPEFKKFLAATLARRGGDTDAIDSTVAKTIAAVRKRGDRALIEFTKKFDRVKLTAVTLRVTSA